VKIAWEPRPGPVPGITAAAVAGAQLSAARYELAPGAVVPAHAHPEEEFGVVLRGTLELEAGTSVVLGAGESFIVPGGAEHGARAGSDGCELIECYAPPR
jgi:quercetin dioxygenase-like cupin family protein